MDIQKAIMMNEKDNVATLLAHVDKNNAAQVMVGGRLMEVRIQGKIQFGHKFALRKIDKGENVIKYGEPIGQAVESLRARGDLL
ncbi:MAG: UxaA family hydrolase [Deltaproteobacteria bacterium]|nr:UxaA family hydrolase [Deltaproteobacteria bacterium]